MGEARLLDTSIFIGAESRSVELPDSYAVSTMTLSELELGVLAATDAPARARRARTLDAARAFDPIPVTEAVASRLARLRADCRVAGVRAELADLIIAATAVEHGLPVLTQDADFERMAEAHPALDVIRI